ncbi:MAG: hypothetical protein U1E45_03420 [Geminicoccaceae bacterium]
MNRVASAYRMAVDLVDFSRRQWRSRQEIEAFQAARLRAVVRHAYTTVPLYRERFDAVGLRPEQIRDLADLTALPVLRRDDLEAASSAAKLSRAFDPKHLYSVRTSGSSGKPLRIFSDPSARRLNKAQFLRALAAGGYRLGHKLMVLASPHAAPPALLRWHFVGRDTPPEQLIPVLRRLRPHFVYGFVTPLRRMAEALLAEPDRRCRIRAVFSSGETLDRASRAAIEEAFRARVYDIWGSAEIGTIGWECPAHDGLHVAEDVAALEFLPMAGSDVAKVVLTSLKGYGMPLLRYEIGDLGAWADDAPCPCGRSFKRITKLQGRLIDCLRRPDGKLVPPYPVEAAIEEVPGVRRFRVVQTDTAAVTVQVVLANAMPVADGVRAALQPLLGEAMRVEVEAVADLEPQPGQKFRLITSRLGPDRR